MIGRVISRKLYSLTSVLVLITSTLAPLASSVPASAAIPANWKAGEIIDDSIFYSGNDMTTAQIQAFLNAEVPVCDTMGTQTSEYGGGTRAQYGASRGYPAPYTCLKDYSENPTTHDNNLNGNPVPAGGISAAQIIKNAATTYNISVRALLVMIQKESAGPLITDTWPFPSQYRNALGYGCPDTAPCDASYAGFYNQVTNAARQFTVYKANPNNYRHKAFQTNAVLFNPSSSCGSSNVYITNYATAGLYNYTPYQPDQAAINNLYGTGDSCSAYGNRNFWRIFTDWFGNPTSVCGTGGNLVGATSGGQVLAYRYADGLPTSLAYTQLNNTGSGCAELHAWNSGYQSWATHVATAMGATDPTKGMLVTMSPTKGRKSTVAYVLYGGSGAVEIHKLSPDLQKFPGYYDVATNLSGVSATTGTFVSGDYLGRGTDQLAYVVYSTGTGHVEVHLFDPSLQRAVGYYDVATNLSNVTATSGSFVAGDFLGRGYDQMAYVIYHGNNGMAEVHLFDPSLQRAVGYYDVATNLAGTSASTGKFVAGDFLGRGYDQLEYVSYTGSTTMVETHLFNPSITQGVGYQDIATNLPGFDPTK